MARRKPEYKPPTADPSEHAIARATAKIRKGWSAAERARRAGIFPQRPMALEAIGSGKLWNGEHMA